MKQVNKSIKLTFLVFVLFVTSFTSLWGVEEGASNFYLISGSPSGESSVKNEFNYEFYTNKILGQGNLPMVEIYDLNTGVKIGNGTEFSFWDDPNSKGCNVHIVIEPSYNDGNGLVIGQEYKVIIEKDGDVITLIHDLGLRYEGNSESNTQDSINDEVVITSDDSKPSSWASSTIEEVKTYEYLEESFFTGYQDNISRQEFAYMAVKLYEILTGQAIKKGNASFIDSDDDWVLKAKNIGIINGYPDGSFKPNSNIRRDEVTVIFNNLFEQVNAMKDDPSSYRFIDDADIASWAKSSVYTLYANGIVNGTGNDKFSPKGNVTKEQSIIMFDNILKSKTLKPNNLISEDGYVDVQAVENSKIFESVTKIDGPYGLGEMNWLEVDEENTNNIYSLHRQHIVMTKDRGETWVEIPTQSGRFPYTISIDPNNRDVSFIGYEIDLGGEEGSLIAKSVNGGYTYVPMWTGMGGYTVYSIAINPDNSDEIYLAVGDNEKSRSVGYEGLLVTKNGGLDFDKVSFDGSFEAYNVFYNHKGELMCVTSSGIYKKIGNEWQVVKEDKFNFEASVDLVSYDGINYILIQKIDGGLYVSQDDGDSWNYKNNSMHGEDVMLVKEEDELVVYVADWSKGIKRSYDFGTSWEVYEGNPVPRLTELERGPENSF